MDSNYLQRLRFQLHVGSDYLLKFPLRRINNLENQNWNRILNFPNLIWKNLHDPCCDLKKPTLQHFLSPLFSYYFD